MAKMGVIGQARFVSPGFVQRQVPPLMHLCPAAHAMPHPPQLAGSVFVLTHWPEQYVIPVAHVQEPFVQVDPPVHGTSHAPQLRGLFKRFVQVPWQSAVAAGQAQAPFEQTRSAGQTCVHPPQFRGSESVSTHEFAHRMVGGAH